MAILIFPKRSTGASPPSGWNAQQIGDRFGAGLLGLWFPGSDGNAQRVGDSSFRMRAAALATNTATMTVGPHGPAWKAAAGANDGVLLDSNTAASMFVQPPLTVMAIYRPDSVNVPPILHVGYNSAANNFAGVILRSSTAGFGIGFGSNAGTTSASEALWAGGTAPVAGTWYVIIGVISTLSGTPALYLNGHAETLGAKTGTATTLAYAAAAQVRALQYSYSTAVTGNGAVAMAAMWNRALTPSEVLEISLDRFAILYQRRVYPASGAAATPIAGSDTGAGADAAPGIAFAGVETGSAADAATIVSSTAAAETGSGANAAAIAIGHADTGSGTEGAGVGPSTGDTGSASEGASATAAITTPETASGANAVAGIDLSRADTGSGAEGGALSLGGADAGTGAEGASGTAALTTGDTASGANAMAGIALSRGDAATVTELVAIALTIGETGDAVDDAVSALVPGIPGYAHGVLVPRDGAAGALAHVGGADGSLAAAGGAVGALAHRDGADGQLVTRDGAVGVLTS